MLEGSEPNARAVSELLGAQYSCLAYRDPVIVDVSPVTEAF